MQYPTIKHHWYCVTAKTDCTITSPSGLHVSLSAGTQSFVYADADSLEIAGEATLTQTPGRFSPAPAAASGGGGSTGPVVPAALPSGGMLKGGKVYLVTAKACLDLSALSVEEYGTCELWIDYTAGSVTLGDWTWPDDDEPATWDAGKRYALVLRNDGLGLLASLNYSRALS